MKELALQTMQDQNAAILEKESEFYLKKMGYDNDFMMKNMGFNHLTIKISTVQI